MYIYYVYIHRSVSGGKKFPNYLFLGGKKFPNCYIPGGKKFPIIIILTPLLIYIQKVIYFKERENIMNNENKKSTEDKKLKEFGLSSKYTSDSNFFATKDLVVLPLFSAYSSDTVTRRLIRNDNTMGEFIIEGPLLNKFDMLVFFALIKIFDTQCNDQQFNFKSSRVEFSELFDIMQLPKDQRKIATKEKINCSISRIENLKITKAKSKRANVFIRFIAAVNLNLDVDDKFFTIDISSEFIEYFREETEHFLCHIDITKYNNLGVSAARFYLYLTANQNYTYICRKYINMIFDLLSIDENNQIIHEVAERDATKRLKKALKELEDAKLIIFSEIIKNHKTRKIEKINFNVNVNEFQKRLK